MAKKLINHQISTTLLLLLLLVSSILCPPPPVSADTVCPYPCYPTPTTTTTTTLTLPPSTQIGSNNYPPPAFVNPPPSMGNLPNYPPPSGFGGGYGPPQPDPILPYFPYYFKNGLHKDQPSSSSSSSLVGDQFRLRSSSLQAVIMACFFIFVLNFPFSQM